MTRLSKTLLLAALAALCGALLLPAGAMRVEGRSGPCSRTTRRSSSPRRPERIRRLNEVKDLGVDTLRIEVKWNEVAPQPELEDEAEVRRLRPDRLRQPPERLPGLLPLRRPAAPRARDRASGSSSRSPATPRAGRPTGGKGTGSNVNYRPSAGEYAQLRGRGGEALLRRSTPACRRSSTSRSGTSPTTASSSSRPRARRRSTATWSTRRSRRSAPRTRTRRSSSARRRRSAARRRRWARRSSSASGCA